MPSRVVCTFAAKVFHPFLCGVLLVDYTIAEAHDRLKATGHAVEVSPATSTTPFGTMLPNHTGWQCLPGRDYRPSMSRSAAIVFVLFLGAVLLAPEARAGGGPTGFLLQTLRKTIAERGLASSTECCRLQQDSPFRIVRLQALPGTKAARRSLE